VSMSRFVLGKFGWLETIAFFTFGLATLFTAAALYYVFKEYPESDAAPAILLAAGTGLLAMAIFPVDPSSITRSFHYQTHLLMAHSVTLLFPIAWFFSFTGLKRHPELYRLASYTLWSAITAIIIYFGLRFTPVGLWERLGATIGFLWLLLLSIYLWRLNSNWSR